MSELSKPLFRSTLAALGGIGGLTFWTLTDPLRDMALAHPLTLFLWAFAGAFFVSAMTAMGPLPTRKALVVGVIVSLPVALLLALASLRFPSLSAVVNDGHLIVTTFLLISLALPFAICAVRDRQWRDYAALFDTSWRLIVHFTAAWIFAGLCWAVLALSAVLLDLVGITVIEDLIDEAVFVMVFTGIVLGLGLAVIFELSDYISPYLVLSLLRLLLIPLAVIVTIFLLALPFRGLSGLFDTLSPALVMMATGIGLIGLISVAVERDDEDAVTGRVMQTATRYACILLVLLTGLAVYAVILRVSAYGWTPPRFAAFFIASVTFAYGLAYALCVLRGPDWMARLRIANTGLALGVMGALALCMTPLINPQALSVNAQLARYERGAMPADQLPFFEMRDNWGRAGQAAFAAFEASEDPTIQDAVASGRMQDGGAPTEDRKRATLQLVRDRAEVRPKGATLPNTLFDPLTDWNISEVVQGCVAQNDVDQTRCVIIQDDFLTDQPGPEHVLILQTGSTRPVLYWLLDETFLLRQQPQNGAPVDSLIDQVLQGGFEVTPAPVNSLTIGDQSFNPFN